MRLAFLLAIAFWAALFHYATAHEWYDYECCTDKDCEPLAPELVQVTPSGYLLPTGQLVPYARVRPSADHDYHWCRYTRESKTVIDPGSDRKLCFYAPPGGV